MKKLFSIIMIVALFVACGNNENKADKDSNKEVVSEKKERLAKDFQLQRALDLIKGLSLYQESFEK